jgi:uncharacterized protein YdeI (YjbR/CyaY-like superfamily)
VEIGPTLYVSDRKAWRAWLAKNHATEKEIWLVYPNAHTGKRRIPYNDAVEEALCYGWIDSIIKKLDRDRAAQRWSPRRSSKSFLSESNKERVRRMIVAGLMTPMGLERIQMRMDEEFVLASDVLATLKGDLQTWKNFKAFPEWYQRIRVGWIDAARHRPEIFNRRLLYFVKMTAQNKRFGMIR